MIKFYFVFLINCIFILQCYADNNCNKIYENCFYNIPIELITYYKDISKYGSVNISDVNLRNIPIIGSKNSFAIKKLNKHDKVEIKKVFFLKGNTYVKLKLLNINQFENINNYRFSKWYLVSYDGEDGFVFADYINESQTILNYHRYRHIDSVDWRNNKVELQKNIEIIIVKNKISNSYELKGYAWHHLSGFYEITENLNIDFIDKKKFSNGKLKLFLFDEDEIYIESKIEIFNGIYKKY